MHDEVIMCKWRDNQEDCMVTTFKLAHMSKHVKNAHDGKPGHAWVCWLYTFDILAFMDQWEQTPFGVMIDALHLHELLVSHDYTKVAVFDETRDVYQTMMIHGLDPRSKHSWEYNVSVQATKLGQGGHKWPPLSYYRSDWDLILFRMNRMSYFNPMRYDQLQLDPNDSHIPHTPGELDSVAENLREGESGIKKIDIYPWKTQDDDGEEEG